MGIAFFPQFAAAQLMYSVTDLGTLGSISAAGGINESGQVVGTSYYTTPTTAGQAHAFLYSNGQLTDLGTLGGSFSEADDINDSGQVVGYSYVTGGGNHAFLYNNGHMTDIGTVGAESQATSINNGAQVVGTSITSVAGTPFTVVGAFVYSNGQMIELGTPVGGFASAASDINASGQIVGNYNFTIGPDEHEHAFLYSNGHMTDLGALSGPGALYPSDSEAFGINDKGEVVGDYSYIVVPYPYTTFDYGAFLYDNGHMTDLGTLGGSNTHASDINNGGQVVGYSNEHAFIYSDGRMSDLNSLLDPRSVGWNLGGASAINDRGQIVGEGYNPSGEDHAFLLTPDPLKYKQFGATTGLQGSGSWANSVINPSAKKPLKMHAAGCTITCLATVASAYSSTDDPGDMLEALRSANLIAKTSNEANFYSAYIQTPDGLLSSSRNTGPFSPFSLLSIAEDILSTGPTMLMVPSATTANSPLKGDFHYVVAYSVDPTAVANGDVTASDIVISDPAHQYFPGVSGADSQTTQVTLANYFNLVQNNVSAFSFTPENWFEGYFTDNTTGQSDFLDSTVKDRKGNYVRETPKLVTTFSLQQNAPIGSIVVESPIELALTDPITGQRYVSDSSIANPGDIVLTRVAPDTTDDLDDAVIDDPDPTDYVLLLPSGLEGESLSVQIIGVGDGDYHVTYDTGSPDWIASDTLVGTIQDGQVIDGMFTVEAAPEPRAAEMVLVSGLFLTSRRRRN